VARMSASRDYYRILHVQPDAPATIVDASFRALLRRAAVSGTPTEEIALLQEAYAVIGDEDRRAAYDRQRLAAEGAPSEVSAQRELDAVERRIAWACLFCGKPHGLGHNVEREDDCAQCGSPLYSAERHRLEYSGQRMLGRVPKQREIAVWVTWPQTAPLHAQMRDLSLNGVHFIVDARLQADQIVRIDCPELRALARVAHVTPDGDAAARFSTGAEFLTLRFRQIRGSFLSARA
jgi:PilZ domain